ncbi:MAG: ribosome maturation factor RimM [Ruminococcus sp.]|nr:ribosome maturation factor RimM [Ruminococcus sp.]
MKKQFLEIGKIVNVHGLKGEVKVYPWCDSPEFLCEFETLYTHQGKNIITVEKSRVQKNMVIMKINGIDTIEQAQTMKNMVIYMNRDDVELTEGSYFIQDLIGLEVYDADTNAFYGTLIDVLETGANDVYTIQNEELHKEYLIPAIPDVVISIDIENNKMTIKPLEEF